MRALSASHTALRPDGLVLDIYPTAGPTSVEAHTDRRAVRIGQVESATHVQKVGDAQAAMRGAIAAQLFALERETTFEFVYHFDSVDAWLEYAAAHWSGTIIGPDLIADARDLLARGAGELHIRREIHAARLRRI